MNFQSIFAANRTTLSPNDSFIAGVPHPDTVMAGFLPLLQGAYPIPLVNVLTALNTRLGARLGLDPGFLITVAGLSWFALRISRQIYSFARHMAHQLFTSSVNIKSSDPLYRHLLRWLSRQPITSRSRHLFADSERTEIGNRLEEDFHLIASLSGEGGQHYLNFAGAESKRPPRYTPAQGNHSFWYQGRYFMLQRAEKAVFASMWAGGPVKDAEDLVLRVYGRSTQPVKELLLAAKMASPQRNLYTDIFRPTNKHGGTYMWDLAASRPIRPMATVILNPKLKSNILLDINEYLHPATRKWYACRGIPLRRGYLFHGPPGTGKSSLSFAIAGVFGLDIYVLSLLDPQLTEEIIASLFSELPSRALVLLEDIDTAGLSRNRTSTTSVSTNVPSSDSQSGEPPKSDDLETVQQPGRPAKQGGISVSSLLNVIDGVASHEGRVLVMTTNRPETLDDALIRPGRIDYQVSFDMTTSKQATDLFYRMYKSDDDTALPTVVQESANGRLNPKSIEVHVESSFSVVPWLSDGTAEVHTTDELLQMAASFGLRVPDARLTPAEVQGFLIRRKKSPRKALEEVDRWVESLIKSKDSGTKILNFQ